MTAEFYIKRAKTKADSGRYYGYSSRLLAMSLALYFFGSLVGRAQPNNSPTTFPVDTSFNIRSELKKQVKYYPNIEEATLGDTSNLTIIRDAVYTNYGERRLHADIVFPRRDFQQPLPVIVFIHGGGWRSGDKSMEHPLAFEMARRGYATVIVEYRRSMEALYPAAVKDIMTAIKWVKANNDAYPFDKDQIILSGTSSGGQLAALIGSINNTKTLFETAQYPDFNAEVQAVINIDGISAFIHPESGEGQDRPGKPSAATLWFGSSVDDDPESRRQASALTYVNPQSAPMLFINSSIPRFGAGRDDMIQKLEDFGIANQAYQHEDCMHTFWLFHPWFEQTTDWMDAFLKSTILNVCE
jgi:pectinesterase